MVFERVSPDGFFTSADSLVGSFGGAGGTSCAILCSGPTVAGQYHKVAKWCQDFNIVPFGINYGGFEKGLWKDGFDVSSQWVCYPKIWTAYDPISNFDAGMLTDPGVMKFIRKERSVEKHWNLTVTSHELPNTYFYYPGEKSFSNFFGSEPIIDSKDSLIQAIDIAIRLGFKTIYLVGADLMVHLTEPQQAWLKERVEKCEIKEKPGTFETYEYGDPDNSLWSLVQMVAKNESRLVAAVIHDLKNCGYEPLYSFGEASTNFEKMVMADHHFYATANWLRQSRRCLDSLGVRVFTTLSHGRLNHVFPDFYITRQIEEHSEYRSDPKYDRPQPGLAKNLPPYRRIDMSRKEKE